MVFNNGFEPTLDAARARLAAVRPEAYARSRNHLDGAVTRLSPYLTHGLLSLPEVLRAVSAGAALPLQHALVRELGWRAYFRHVWQARGDGILDSLRPGPLPDSAYAAELPADLREGRTGVPVVDRAVAELYATGWLHNHARLWLASYAVHVRKLHWRAGADWMLAHLLDGDLASNHLSWQWVAGTASRQPYLFDADNVARHAPPAWHSPGTPVDASHDALGRLARDAAARPAAPCGPGVPEPAVLDRPPVSLATVPPDPAALRGRDVWIVHPWSLGPLPADLAPGTVVLGLFVADFHRRWPWSARRWDFVGRRMAELTPLRWHGSAQAVEAALAPARVVRTSDDPHLAPWLPMRVERRPAPALFPAVAERCDSFSRWWSRVVRQVPGGDAQALLATGPVPS